MLGLGSRQGLEDAANGLCCGKTGATPTCTAAAVAEAAEVAVEIKRLTLAPGGVEAPGRTLGDHGKATLKPAGAGAEASRGTLADFCRESLRDPAAVEGGAMPAVRRYAGSGGSSEPVLEDRCSCCTDKELTCTGRFGKLAECN